MKSSDHRAIVVEYSYGENDLFMNYQIARAFTDRLTFPAIQKVGHPVLQWSGSGPRMGLFSMNKTSVGAIAKITSAFESVGGGGRREQSSADAPQSGSIGPNDISPRPNLTTQSPEEQIYFYVLKEDVTPVGGWTEGASVIPCYAKTDDNHNPPRTRTICIHTPLQILAVHTAYASGEASWLAIGVPTNLRCTFAEFALADKRLLFQISPKTAKTGSP
jgi:hypothetical protein